MTINLTPEQERIVSDALKSGHFRTAEEVISQALVALRDKERPATGDGQEAAVHEMLDFVGKNKTSLRDISIKQLIHEGHRL